MSTVLKPVAPSLTVAGQPLPITGISAKGKIHPILATLELTQEFVNGEDLADVTYHAPIHPDWAVRAVTMRCDDRVIRTIVLPQQKAQKMFDQAREEGYTAVLAKEDCPDEMQLQLANVPPGAKVSVTSEVVAWPTVERNRGSLIIPLINGPKCGADESHQPFFSIDDPDERKSAVKLDLDLFVGNPKVDVGTIKPVVTSDFAKKMVDGVQMMRISGEIAPVGQITVEFDARPTALYHEDENGRYLVVGVPAVRPDDAMEWGRTAMIVDRSGSMNGIGIATAIEVSRAVQNRIGDNITHAFMFDGETEQVWPKGHNDKGLNAADAIAAHGCPGGWTNLRGGLTTVADLLEGEIDNIILVTDALSHDESICGVARDIANRGIAVHTVLVSTSPSRFVGEAVSLAGGGFFMDLAGGKIDPERIEDGISRFLLGGANLDAVTVDDRRIECHLPVRGKPLMIPVNVDERPETIVVELDGKTIGVPIKDRDEAEFVWAREIVMGIIRESISAGRFAGYGSLDFVVGDKKQVIEDIGVKHQILTPFTSFVGFDSSESFDRTGVKEIIAQMSLAEGVDAGGFFGLPKGGELNLGGSSRTSIYSFYCASANVGAQGPIGSVGPCGTVGSTGAGPGFYSPFHTPTSFNAAGNGSYVRGSSMPRVFGSAGPGETVIQTSYCGAPAGFKDFKMNTSFGEVTADHRGDDDTSAFGARGNPQTVSEQQLQWTEQGLDLNMDTDIESLRQEDASTLFSSGHFSVDAANHQKLEPQMFELYSTFGSVHDQAATILWGIAENLEHGLDPIDDVVVLAFSRNAIALAAIALKGILEEDGLETELTELSEGTERIIQRLVELAAIAGENRTAGVLMMGLDIPKVAIRVAEAA